MAARIVSRLRGIISRDVTVAVLGLAYKPLSHVIEESPAIALAKAFLDAGARVLGYDPLAGTAADLELGGRALILDSVRDCLREADVVVVATPDPEFRTLTISDFASPGRQVTVIDFWRILPCELSAVSHIVYVPYGRGGDDADGGVLQRLWGETALHYGS